MFKIVAVYVMLLNYFLVVVVTNITTANAVKYTHSYSAESPYVHAPDCQQRYYLQFDCFDTCNDEKQIDTPVTPLHQYLLLLASGLDFHQITSGLVNNQHLFYPVILFTSVSHFAAIPGFVAVPCPPPNFC